MAKDLNKVMLTGRLGRDVDLKYTPSGQAVATFSVASDRSIRDESDPSGWKQETEWFRVVAWRDLAERIAKNLTKGRRVYIEGRIQTRDWTDQQGQKRTTTEVIANDYILLDSPNRQGTEGGDDEIGEAFNSAPAGRSNGNNGGNNRANSRGSDRYASKNSSNYEDELETEDIPF
jgi:single-strand DNA-binding protein